MKKVLITFVLLGLIIQSTFFAQNAICGIGANLVQDPYNKKVFVFKTYPNSMALKCDLPEGAEIISVDDQKVKKLNINQVTELIRG